MPRIDLRAFVDSRKEKFLEFFNSEKNKAVAAGIAGGVAGTGVVLGGIAATILAPPTLGGSLIAFGAVGTGTAAYHTHKALKEGDLKDRRIKDLTREGGVLEERVNTLSEKIVLLKKLVKKRDETAKEFKKDGTKFAENVDRLREEREKEDEGLEELKIVAKCIKTTAGEQVKPLTDQVEGAIASAKKEIGHIDSIVKGSRDGIERQIDRIKSEQVALKELIDKVGNKVTELLAEQIALNKVYEMMKKKKDNE